MIDVSTKEQDETPPQFSPVVNKKGNRGKRSTSTCDISQIKNRDYTEPAFEISVAAADDRSNVKFFLDVGTFPAGSNVVNNRQLGGSATVLATAVDEYPSGEPLYYTVYAENSAGTRAGVTCMLTTYDTTEPTARISPAFLSTSNPNVIKASVLVHDDSLITEAYTGVGYGKGSYGDQIIPWTLRNLHERPNVPSGGDPLKQFSDLEDGKFVSHPISTKHKVSTATACAQSCLALGHCVSFNYDYGPSGTCELLRSVRQFDDTLAKDGLFCHFERLSSGHTVEVKSFNLNMRHNRLHYVNIDLKNVLGYRSIIPSAGILTDYTCPEPGPIVNSSKDALTTDDCLSLIPPDRPDLNRYCIGIYSKRLNHRTIIDGEGSRTVFNGDKPVLDLKYTRSNNYIAGNWDGITDDETGIRAYALSVGRHICEDSIHPHHDPHKHLMHESQWTNMAIMTATADYNPFPLPSGKYYITVRAINKVEYGGPLATTICHTVPYIIDITNPFVYEIFDIKYDELQYVISAEHNSTDFESGIDTIELCIGDNPRNCELLKWTRRPKSQYINYTHHIPDGIPAWIRLRVTNNVELHSVGRADQAIIVDASPPINGTVFDGPLFKEDLQYTKFSKKICLNWYGFYDPESGISSYEIGVGTSPGSTDVAELKTLKQNEHSYCVDLDEHSTLIHDHVYYPIVWANNGAINQKNISGISNGVRVDLTQPIAGKAVDGTLNNLTDVEFSSSKSTVKVQWDNFYDKESGIREYDILVARKRHGSDWTIIKDWSKIANTSKIAEWRNFHLNHTDEIRSTVKATNGALNDVEIETSGFIVDLTSPLLEHLNDGSINGKDLEFQVDATEAHVNYQFKDPESGIKELRYQLHEQKHGTMRQIYPGTKGLWIEIRDTNATKHTESGLTLSVGHKYISRLVAINGAGLISTYETNGFIIENTPPKIRWIRVGVLSGLEHLIDGHVYQSDHEGIKVCWSASDPESGITAIQYSVGTTKGSDDIMPWTETQTTSDSAYLPCSLNDTDTDNSNKPVYYVSLKAKNGAGLWGTVKNSSPIIVVPEDVTGIVHDGPFEELTEDIDYQADAHTVTMRFSGFESSLHGIMSFDWAIGTSPGAEDVQPFLEDGIIHNEEEDIAGNGFTSSGFAQTVVDLDHGGTYFTTLRAKTNKGDILQATTNGFIVDTTRPEVQFDKLSDSTANATNAVLYQKDESVLSAVWNFSDPEYIERDNINNIDLTWFSVGSIPYIDNIYNLTYQNISSETEANLPVGDVRPSLEGTPNVINVGVTNKAGLEKSITSPPIVQDNTAPLAGTIECQDFVQSHSVIECSWNGFVDKESEIAKYYITFGSKQGYDDWRLAEEIPGYTTMFSAKDVVKDHNDKIYATVAAENRVGLTVRAYSKVIVVDDTPPTAGVVVELSSVARIDPNNVDKTVQMNRKACTTKQECEKIDAVCTEAFTHLSVAWTHFSDDESEIIEYQLAIGISPGGAEISPFISLAPELNHYTVKNIDLKGQREVFATVKASNFAGHTTSAYSNGVYLSYLSQGLPPLEHVGIYDSHQHSIGDVEFQSDTNTIEAKWDVSGDPCPVVKYEWSVEETDGTVIQDYIDMFTSTGGSTDQLDLKEGRRYYSLLRVQNMLGYVYTLRSDGVTINSNPMLPGMVYDGDVTGYDLKVLSSRTMVSANWEGFGELRQPKSVSEILTGNKGVDEGDEVKPDQQVAYYEVALGSDRRFDKTRDNVVPFTNVGLNTSVTFKDLDLGPGFAVYYFTVRAFSASSSSATITSNGFFVSFDGGVSAGSITMPDYINSDKTISVQWNDYTSNVGIMLYYIAISDHQNTTSGGDCRRYVDGGKATDKEKEDLFNVYNVTTVGVSTYLSIDELTLTQNSSYFLYIMGVDKAGECNMTFKRFTVDVTQPETGKITAGPYFDMALAYTRYKREIKTKWEGFNDGESGIDTFRLTLWHAGLCSAETTKTLMETIEVFGNYTEYRFTNLSIESNVVYKVHIEAINRARLITSAETSPIVFDNSLPTAGHVSEGSDFTEDLVWWGYTDHMKGTLLHNAIHVSDPCPSRNISMSDTAWKPVEIKHVNDPDGIDWKIQHRLANIRYEAYDDAINIKISRDSKAERIYSAAYMRKADMKDGGIYDLSIRAADGDGMAVTGVTFWDGDDNDLHIFSHQTKAWNDHGSCSCCLESNTTACLCNCAEYIANLNMYTGTVNENSTGQNKSFDIDGPSDIVSQQSCGFQIYAGQEPYVVTWCKFFNNTGKSMSVRSEIDFNPSTDFHHYRIAFFIVKEDISATTCINVFADGIQISEMCGLPSLSIHTKLILHVWNKDNIVPALDVFNLWQATAAFKDLVMPPDVNALCRYGNPFQGGTNAIVKYEAGIGKSPGAVDMVPFQEVIKPCLPCITACSKYNCAIDCKSDAYSLKHFTIKDINLDESFNKTLYLSVKAVLGSGGEVIASSNGFYIDITPPLFDEQVMMYIDVRQGEFTPSDFQGSNNTIKALWLCNDDKSEIEEYKWAIGTDVGFEDLQPYTSTGTVSTAINDQLEGKLEHNTTYFVSIACTNAAGLTTIWKDKKGVTVLLEAPDPDTVKADAVGAEKFTKEVVPATAVKSEDPTSCGESWTVSTDPNIRRYDFCVGTSMDKIDDIIPCVWVGYNMSGVVEIKNEFLLIDGIKYRKISELRALSEGVYDYSTPNDDDNTFRMESGRTLFLFMRLCNKAEICINKFVNSLLITDDKSELLSSFSGKGEIFQLKTSQDGRVKRSAALGLSLEMPEGMENGQSILYNELSEENMTMRYDSAASTIFKSYIVNPDDTSNQTERLLYRRIHAINMSLTLSPVGQKPLPGPLKLLYPSVNTTGDDTVIMVIHWNPDLQMWQITNNTCMLDNITIANDNADLSSILICDTRLSSNNLTGNQTYLSKETQFALAAVSSKIFNNPPTFLHTTITIDEDSETTQFQLRAKDAENDPFVYSLVAENNVYSFGNLTLSSNGLLTVSLCPNCFGTSTVNFTLEDRPTWDDIMPSHASYSIDINVLPANDPPVISAFSKNGTFILHNDPTDPIMIYREQDGEIISEVAAIIIAYDVDGPQNLQMKQYTNNDSDSYNTKDVSLKEMQNYMTCSHGKCSFDTLPNPSSAAWKGVSVIYTQDNTSFVGIETIKLVAQDENGTFSDVVNVQLIIMENKCQHGKCLSLNPRQYTCNDTRRAINFDKYYTCECPTSWEGPYCEQDVDECARGFCEAWKVCDNNIGSYDCYCKATDIICKLSLEVWEFAVIVTAVVLIILMVCVVFIVRKFKSKQKKDYEKEESSGSIALKAFLRNIRNLGSGRPRLGRIAPYDTDEHDSVNESETPRLASLLTSYIHADIHKNGEEDDFVHPAPRFDKAQLEAELQRKKEEAMKDVPEEELQDHPPPELNHPHVVTKFRKNTVAPKKFRSEFKLFSGEDRTGFRVSEVEQKDQEANKKSPGANDVDEGVGESTI